MATFSVLNGTGMNGAGIQFGSLGTQIATSGIAGFPIITPATGSIFYNDTGLLSLSGTGMSFIFPDTYGGTVSSLTYAKPAITPIFSISGFSESLNDMTGLMLPGGDELATLVDLFSDDDTISGSTMNDLLMGFDGADTITGADGNDALIGGSGADVLQGGNGSDTAIYRGSGSGVTVDLMLGTGTDADAAGDVLTDIENLTGSLFSDTLTGDNGDNILNDGGVGGADALSGNGGNDRYAVYNAGALIVEMAGEGTDRVSAGVNFVLAGGVSAEYLNTTSLLATYAVNLIGNEIGQLVRGNGGANVLDGAGGNDMLFGMGGADAFRFSTALGTGNVDRLGDFNVAEDQIELDDAIFSALGLGVLDASAFKDNATAPRDADDRIFYNSNTGSLFYDADGSGNGFAAVKFASLSAGLSLTAADFVVI